MKRYPFTHRNTLIASLFMVGVLAACSPGSSDTPAASVAVNRSYTGSAAVGDLVQVSVNATAQTISYTNKTNGQTETVSYTVNSDGTYTISDPSGNLVTAYEIPNYAILIEANDTGPGKNTPSLITAIPAGQISLATFTGTGYNYMQFRTSSGGMTIGSLNVTQSNNASITEYWPYGSMVTPATPFNSGSIAMAGAVEDSSGTFLTVVGPDGGPAAIFGTANGTFAIDTPQGTIFGLQKASTAAFQPSYAGTYTALAYTKPNASTGPGNIEIGTPAFAKLTITVDASGNLTLANSAGTTLATGALTPVSSVPYIYGSGELTDPCNGLFTLRISAGGNTEDIFIAFQSSSILFSTFEPTGSSTYNYSYGVGLK